MRPHDGAVDLAGLFGLLPLEDLLDGHDGDRVVPGVPQGHLVASQQREVADGQRERDGK
jgi:hypothetical protein